jgi:HD-GYP domain-containing protein (c-di-GMP phosphodiesterase class II)
MNLIEYRKNLLSIGNQLQFTLRDERGAVLLAKGLRIESDKQMAALYGREKIFVDADDYKDGTRVLMAGIKTLNKLGAPIKDFSKHLHPDGAPPSTIRVDASLSERWSTIESKLGGLLASVSTTPDFEKKILSLEQQMQDLLTENKWASQFLLFNRAVTHFTGYSASHSLLCAGIVHSLAPLLDLTDSERRSMVCAALTMNVAMTRLQDVLAAHVSDPSPTQRKEIDGHAAVGKQTLLDAKVSDPLWPHLVELHHAKLEGPDTLAQWPPRLRLAKILQTVDCYTASMSPRRSRSGRTARDAVLNVVMKLGSTKRDEMGSALVRMLGLCPPGTYVSLANGETAVVVRRGSKPTEPLVASVLNRYNEPIAEPRLHDTSGQKLAILHTLAASEVKVNIKMDALLALIPK